MDFPSFVSLTVTNACNLRCKMCAQWSETGYMHDASRRRNQGMKLEDWKRVIDELTEHGTPSLLIRGGEPFLHPEIRELLYYIAERGLHMSIDTNGTQLAEFAEDLVNIQRIHVTISVDGPASIHDRVRGAPGCFERIRGAILALKRAEDHQQRRIGKSITFTISPWSYEGLGEMPAVARSLGIDSLCLVPFFYAPEAVGRAYELELREELNCDAFSWCGYAHEASGVPFESFREQLERYRASLGTLTNYPYLPLSDEEFRTWFESPTAPVFMPECLNVERLLDIQPSGDANFCVDSPDYSLGNVREASVQQLWNGDRAQRFRSLRRQRPLAACHRCVAKYMAVPRHPDGSLSVAR